MAKTSFILGIGILLLSKFANSAACVDSDSPGENHSVIARTLWVSEAQAKKASVLSADFFENELQPSHPGQAFAQDEMHAGSARAGVVRN